MVWSNTEEACYRKRYRGESGYTLNSLYNEAVLNITNSTVMTGEGLVENKAEPAPVEPKLSVIWATINELQDTMLVQLKQVTSAYDIKLSRIEAELKKVRFEYQSKIDALNIRYTELLLEQHSKNGFESIHDHDHLLRWNLYPILQSAYRQNHSTEIALLKVLNDILMNMNSQRVTLLVLLDLSSAFDTIDYKILLERLSSKFGFLGKVLNWFSSYLSGRSYRVMLNGTSSDKYELNFGFPQGSCLGPLFFILYASKLFDIVGNYLPDSHCFADDSQLYMRLI